MAGLETALAGAALGGLGGALNKTKDGDSVGNRYGGDSEAYRAKGALQSAQTMFQALQDQPNRASEYVQADPILGKLFGPQGTLSNTVNEEQNLANRGYSLQPEDHEAYGQASGNIARMFGSQEQGLAQDLASRGLSNSGVAGQAFSGMYGNKMEQLGQLQTQIAQNRMKMNMDRLAQTRSFLGQLGGQAENAIQGQYNRQSDAAGKNYDASMGVLGNLQGQDNTQLAQRRAGVQPTDESKIFSGILSGAKVGAGMSGGGGGALSGEKKQTAGEAYQNPGEYKV